MIFLQLFFSVLIPFYLSLEDLRFGVPTEKSPPTDREVGVSTPAQIIFAVFIIISYLFE